MNESAGIIFNTIWVRRYVNSKKLDTDAAIYNNFYMKNIYID
jgi:hypothetical protein